jgi:long-chain acyl-CoA synthetase
MRHEHIGSMVYTRRAPDAIAFRVKRAGTYVDVPWTDVLPRIDALAAGLLSSAEIEDGACVSIIGNTSMEWVIADFAAFRVGLKPVPIYASLLPEEVGYMHVDTACQLVIAENAAQLEKVRIARRGFTFFDIRYEPERFSIRGKIIVVDPSGLAPAEDWESLTDVEARGRERLADLREEMERRASGLRRDDVATFTYTSGTTGPPKAVMQTHGNMLSMLESISSAGIFGDEARRHGMLLFLPLAHSFGRLVEFAGPFFGAPIIISSVPTLAEDLLLSRPGFFPGAPRVYEKMMAKVVSAIDGSPRVRKLLARWALDTGNAASVYTRLGQPVPRRLRIRHALAEKIVLSKLRARLGLENAEILLSGSAPLRSEVHEFFLSVGLPLLEAYGLTETCPGLTTNRLGAIRVGTVGQAFQGVSLRISDEGEILAKGPNIMPGYLNRADATAEAFDGDGWFRTGDLGSLDSDGFLRITGRKKELFKTSGGKYIAPTKIEARLKGLPIVQEAVVIADGRHFCSAVFAIDTEMLAHFAGREGIPSDPRHARVRAALQALVDEVNAGLASFEQIKKFCVAPQPFSVDGGELTASLKVKRRVVLEKYGALVEAMYRRE